MKLHGENRSVHLVLRSANGDDQGQAWMKNGHVELNTRALIGLWIDFCSSTSPGKRRRNLEIAFRRERERRKNMLNPYLIELDRVQLGYAAEWIVGLMCRSEMSAQPSELIVRGEKKSASSSHSRAATIRTVPDRMICRIISSQVNRHFDSIPSISSDFSSPMRDTHRQIKCKQMLWYHRVEEDDDGGWIKRYKQIINLDRRRLRWKWHEKPLEINLCRSNITIAGNSYKMTCTSIHLFSCLLR